MFFEIYWKSHIVYFIGCNKSNYKERGVNPSVKPQIKAAGTFKDCQCSESKPYHPGSGSIWFPALKKCCDGLPRFRYLHCQKRYPNDQSLAFYTYTADGTDADAMPVLELLSLEFYAPILPTRSSRSRIPSRSMVRRYR